MSNNFPITYSSNLSRSKKCKRHDDDPCTFKEYVLNWLDTHEYRKLVFCTTDGDVSSFAADLEQIDETKFKVFDICIQVECGGGHCVIGSPDDSFAIYDISTNSFTTDVYLNDKYNDGFGGVLSRHIRNVFCDE